VHGQASAADQITRHADNVGVVRVRFAAVKDASAAIARDDNPYGLLCRWVSEDFRAKHVRQDELVAYVEENLRLIGVSLCRVARVEVTALDPARMPAGPSLIAPVTVRAVARVGWTMEQVASLREVLDQLTGRPEVIAAHAATWHNIAVELQSMAEELEDRVEYDIPGWHGDEADEHRRLMANNVAAIQGLGSVSAALAEITETVGVLVAQTRRIVRDLVIDLIALAVPLPASTAQQDATFARWAFRIAVYAVALEATLTHLDQRLNG
jgi:uncharacterized protein YukE